MTKEIWEQQCDAAVKIREDFGWWKAVGYLVGEKFIETLRHRARFGEETLVSFADRIREVIPRNELESYFKNVERTGALGHVMEDDGYREAGRMMDGRTPSDFAEDVLLLEQARALLLK